MYFPAPIQAFDSTSLHAVQAGINPILTLAMLAITFLGNPVLWVGIATLFYWRGQENKSFFLMNLVLFTAAVVGALKAVIARPRPSEQEFRVLGLDKYVEAGFPSGHSALIAAAFAYFWKMPKRHWKALLALAVPLVAYSRLYLGMHFPTDVLAGLVLGFLVGKSNLFARNKLFHRNFRPSKLEDELALVALLAVGIIALVFFRSLPMAGIFIGFYAGFFLFKERGLKQTILLRKRLLAKYFWGFAPLLVLLGLGEGIAFPWLLLSEIQRFALYLLAGFWISWIWPLSFEWLLRAKQ